MSCLMEKPITIMMCPNAVLDIMAMENVKKCLLCEWDQVKERCHSTINGINDLKRLVLVFS